MNNINKHNLPLIIFLIILNCAVWVRFDGITQQGINRGDCFDYLEEGKTWADGQAPNFLNGKFFRPAAYSIQGNAIKLLGYNDYAIKVAHASLDIFSVVMIFSIITLLAGNMWCGNIGVLAYAFLPNVVYLARIEMVHATSTFFVLVALLFFILSERHADKKKGPSLVFLILSGFAAGLATNTHIDLAFLGPGYVCYILLHPIFKPDGKFLLKRRLLFSVFFTVSFFIPYLLFAIGFGFDTVWNVFSSEISNSKDILASSYGATPKHILLANVLINSFKYYFKETYVIMLTLYGGAMFFALFYLLKLRGRSSTIFVSFILTWFYIIFYVLMVNTFPAHYGRVFMPILALVIITLSLWCYKVIEYTIPRQITPALIVVVIAIAALVIFDNDINYKRTGQSPYRYSHDLLKEEVKDNSKLLIAPAATYSYDHGFQSDIYFGENALYIGHLTLNDQFTLDINDKNMSYLIELLAKKRIGYIFIRNKLDKRLLDKNYDIPQKSNRLINLKKWVQNSKFEYTVGKEIKLLMSYIIENGGIKLDDSKFGSIYLIPKKRNQENQKQIKMRAVESSFEEWKDGVPETGWRVHSGSISISEQKTHGKFSLQLHPNRKKGTRILKTFPETAYRFSDKFIVTFKIKAQINDRFAIFLSGGKKERRITVSPGKIVHVGTGEWEEVGYEFDIADIDGILQFNMWLDGSAKAHVNVDELVIDLAIEK